MNYVLCTINFIFFNFLFNRTNKFCACKLTRSLQPVRLISGTKVASGGKLPEVYQKFPGNTIDKVTMNSQASSATRRSAKCLINHMQFSNGCLGKAKPWPAYYYWADKRRDKRIIVFMKLFKLFRISLLELIFVFYLRII